MDYQDINLLHIREEIFDEKQEPFAKNVGIKYRTYQKYERKGVPHIRREKVRNLLLAYAKKKNKVLDLDNLPEKENPADGPDLNKVREVSEFVVSNQDVFLNDVLFKVFIDKVVAQKLLEIEKLNSKD